MDWKTWLKQCVERYAGIRLYRYSLPRGVDFAYDARQILVPDEVSVVFDVGANIGQYANRFRAAYPNAQIFCFEPVSTVFEQLDRQVAEWRQVKAYRIAFGSARESKNIYVNSDPSMHSFVNALPEKCQEMVQVRTLDDFCLQNGISNIDLLKIDVEGYELEVLRGAKRMLSECRIKALYLESTARSNRSHSLVPVNEIDEHVARYGYSIFGIYEQEIDRRSDTRYLYFFNAAFVQQKLCGKRSV